MPEPTSPSQPLAFGCMIEGRTCSRPALQHERHWLVSELRMALQKAIKARKPEGLRLVAEPPGAHQCNVVAHQIAKDTAEVRELAERFERPITLRQGMLELV